MTENTTATTRTIPEINAVDGFAPAEFTRSLPNDDGSTSLYMDVKYRLLWFRLHCPNGKADPEIIHIDDKCAVVCCKIYRDRSDPADQYIRGSGIMIPDRNCKGEIEVRLDKVYHSKFYTLTSVEQYCGTTASCCPHFAGVEQGMETVYLTEGVMKSDVARSISVQLGLPRAFVGLTGVSNITQCQRALQELTAMGVRRINLAFDMDALTNPNVRKAKERVLETANEAGFEVFPISWSPAYKGIDDLLLSKLQRQLNQQSK